MEIRPRHITSFRVNVRTLCGITVDRHNPEKAEKRFDSKIHPQFVKKKTRSKRNIMDKIHDEGPSACLITKRKFTV